MAEQLGMAEQWGMAEQLGSWAMWQQEEARQGEVFERGRHEAGTEIKAITYSAMSIREGEGDAEVFVIVDI
ncbi:Protein archease-like [Tetrabaena socialis]|uniref:Protein archease-like n=1 Tax=Tetrabaena socialis TaxID=47790 RepID=A0A2J8A6G4_9CHLO|nr:Protein archease-like [Tetrabaena socialis]|eukprot:PNH08121.1 Protein archease-like [Tetrabaena socialis]